MSTPAGPDAAAIADWLVTRLAGRLGERAERIDVTAPFASFGLSSVEAVGLSGELEEWLDRELQPALLYEHPTVAALSAHLATPAASEAPAAAAGAGAQEAVEPIAIVGMAIRGPAGIAGLDAFWRFLCSGSDAVGEVPAGRWDEPAGTTRAAWLDDIAGFDAGVFQISPREALRMDPQQRLTLETAWEAIEDAGLDAGGLRGSRTGAFVGTMSATDYSQVQLRREGRGCLDDPYFGMGSAASVVAGRLSYVLDLRGPSMTVDTACSSSLVCVHLACGALRVGECDLALAGGVHAILLPETLAGATRMGLLAADGRTKAFDEAADGFVFGEGAGMVVLERLSDAVARGDRVHAVITGSAVNQDGRTNGLTAPSAQSQRELIRAALRQARLAPDQVDFVEAHGTGTALGDAIEMGVLDAVFGGRRADHPLVVGAVKTAIGHLAGAAGVAGLIKATLAVHRGTVPPNLHLRQLNPTIAALGLPLVLPAEPLPWHARPRRCGVSSFGWSGTNAHVVLEEPAAAAAPPDRGEPGWQLLPLSAASDAAADETVTRLGAFLAGSPGCDIADVAYTLQTGRARFPVRRALVCRDAADAVAAIAEPGRPRVRAGTARTAPTQTAEVEQPVSHRTDGALDDACRLWLSGVEPDWEGVRRGPRPARVSLPTYPFEHRSYWPAAASSGPDTDDALAKRRDVGTWFHVPVWRQRQLPAAPAGTGSCLLFGTGHELEPALASALAGRGRRVVHVRRGESWARLGPDAYSVRPGRTEDCDCLLDDLAAGGVAPVRIVHAWSLSAPSGLSGDSVDRSQELGFHALVALVQALGRRQPQAQVTILAVGHDLQPVLGDEPPAVGQATLMGLCRTVDREHPAIRVRCVDVSSTAASDVRWLAGQLAVELDVTTADDVVAYRHRRRWVRLWEPAPLEPPPAERPAFRVGGTYLITGGLGGVGLGLAERLAGAVRARLALLGRTVPPRREEWDAWVAAHDPSDPTSRAIAGVRRIEALGGEVLVLRADVTDPGDVNEAVSAVHNRFGPIHGAIHAAGVPGRGLLQRKTAADAAAVLAPKVAGTIVLDEALAAEPLDFLVLCSSATALVGGLGEVDYSAANAFLDAYATARRAQGRPVTALDWAPWQWDTWQSTAYAGQPAVQQAIRRLRDRFGITFDEGFDALARAASAPHPHLLVLPQDPETTIRQWTTAAVLRMVRGRPAEAGLAHPRPNLGNPYVPPRNQAERTLADLWKRQLGLDRVGVHDHFFELGGSSLLGVALIEDIQDAFGIRISPATLFEAPTVAAQARLLAPDREPAANLTGDSARGELRRQLRRARAAGSRREEDS